MDPNMAVRCPDATMTDKTQERPFDECSGCAELREIYNPNLGLCNSCNRQRLREMRRAEQGPPQKNGHRLIDRRARLVNMKQSSRESSSKGGQETWATFSWIRTPAS